MKSGDWNQWQSSESEKTVVYGKWMDRHKLRHHILIFGENIKEKGPSPISQMLVPDILVSFIGLVPISSLLDWQPFRWGTLNFLGTTKYTTTMPHYIVVSCYLVVSKSLSLPLTWILTCVAIKATYSPVLLMLTIFYRLLLAGGLGMVFMLFVSYVWLTDLVPCHL